MTVSFSSAKRIERAGSFAKLINLLQQSLIMSINVERQDENESIRRIKAELLPDPTSLIWYDDLERKLDFGLWSLSKLPQHAEQSEPIAQYKGTELSSG